MLIGQKIAAILAEKGWSASKLAKCVGVTPAAITRVINGGDTSTAIGYRIASALSVPCSWLFDHERHLPAPQESRAADLAQLDQSTVLEDALRRKRAAVHAFLVSSGGYGALRGNYQVALRRGVSRRNDSADLEERLRHLWTALRDHALIHGQTIRFWLEYERRWRETDFPTYRNSSGDVRDAAEAIQAEMLEVMNLVNEYGMEGALAPILRMWHPSASEQVIEAAAEDVLSLRGQTD